MKRPAKYFLGTGVLLAVAAGAWFIFSMAPGPVPAKPVETAGVAGSGILDGMTFSSELGPLNKPADVKDTLIFKDGTFVSTECEKKCNYPARPYFTRQAGDRIEFISESRCLDKDATIVWRGTIADGKIKGKFRWTISRWYWTVEKDFRFSGTLANQAEPIAGSQ